MWIWYDCRMRFVYAVIFVCVIGFLTAHATSVPKNPTLAEWLAKGAIPKYQNGVFSGLLTNKDIEKTANNTAAALKKKSDAANGNIYRPKPAFDRLKWEKENPGGETPSLPACVRQPQDCETPAVHGFTNSCGSRIIALNYARCRWSNAAQCASRISIFTSNLQNPRVKSCFTIFDSCARFACPNVRSVMVCAGNFSRCLTGY